jgi:hypothetical protein
MALAPLTEADIIDQIYSSYENDNSTWSSTSAEYLTARRFCKAAILRWEYLEGSRWNELYTTLTEASDGTKTVTSGTYTYGCPTNMHVAPQPGSYVRLVDSGGAKKFLLVIPLAKVEQLSNTTADVCYFTGNPKLGFTLNIHSSVSLTTGNTINYEYWRNATYFTTTTSTTEMSNPFFIVHYVLWRLYKNDGLLTEAQEEFNTAETLLEEMKSETFSVLNGEDDGFGY